MGSFRCFLYSLLLLPYSIGMTKEKCESPQYLVLGKTGTVECSFKEDFHAVIWYNTTNLGEGKPLLQIVDGVKDGNGYETGQYDICANGSLTINNVTLGHEHNFTVFILKSQTDDAVSMQVEVVVIVQPSLPFPFVEQCGERPSACYTQLGHDSKLECIVEDARPAVPLVWVDRTSGRDRNVSLQSSVSQNHSVFTTKVTALRAFPYSSLLSLLACKADVPPALRLNKEATILIENSDLSKKDAIPIVRYFERGSRLSLTCSEKNISLILWKKADQIDDVFQVLAYAALFEDVLMFCSDPYELQKDGSLVLPQVEVKHDGFYECIYENDNFGDAVLYHVVVFVRATPVVHGCLEDRYCALDAQTEGSLSCSLKGILPKVLLEWKTFHESEASLISFTNQRLDVSSNGELYDINLTSTYQVHETKKDRITIECKVSESSIEVWQSSTRIDIVFAGAVQTTDKSTSFPFGVLIVAVILMCIILFFSCVLIIRGLRRRLLRKRKSRRYPMFKDVEPSLLLSDDADCSSDTKATLIKQLKTKYKDQYDSVQPIPYIRDRLYCVDRVFVESGFEKRISKGKIEGSGNWEKLNSYHEVTKSSSTRTIIEGDPGYGKSTLALQLAYDWCNSTPESPLADVGIFILLRLRQLGGVQSVFKAIKQFILPRDSTLEETDIENIMYESKSTVIILDGYDEYPEEETGNITDIISIIRKEMLQENIAILTTRSSLLPNSYPPQTQRIRLTGFDEKARDTYIRKAVVGDDEAAAEKIKHSLQNNPVLKGLSQVPLFFVMYAHMTHESETFLKFNSVTSFFRYMITCFHSHMANKQRDPNVSQLTLYENDHEVMDQIAFQGLSGKNQKIVWEKSEICKLLGIGFYNQYKRIGILVEEEVLDLEVKPGSIQYKLEVRFYHKLFCEWYAAHYLSRMAVQPEVNLGKLLVNMNPFDLQYTYRFACGLNQDAGNKIMEYLRGIKDGDKFSVLCILEQTGNIDQIKNTIRDLCSNYITIENNDSMLLQGSIVQLLEIGAGYQMPIPFVWLKDCFNSVDISTGSILLKSELSIPVLSTIEELAIGERGRKLETMEISNLLDYSLKCSNLKILRFCYFLLPQSIQAKCISSIQKRNVQVLWITDDAEYCLDLSSGRWKEIDTGSTVNTSEFNIQAKKSLLISFMKGKYEELTSVIQPIPNNKDQLYSVDQVFVNCGLECLTYKDGNSTGTWEPIDSYQDIFSDSRVIAKRSILEGKPGFGKSTFALKMAYDWCSDKTKSTISNFDLFFLFDLGHSGYSKSIYKQLKQDYLPKDSSLSDGDIRQMLQVCSSALIMFDDYNIYEDQLNMENSDVMKIIKGKMLSNIDVIITSTDIPKVCARGAKHLRLTGFDSKTQDEYIQKVLVSNDVESASRIKQQLMENPTIKNVSKIPFYFVLFAHMSQESKVFETFKKDTVLFSYILENLRCRLTNQTNDNCKMDLWEFEKINHGLRKVAFECFFKSNQRLEWRKKEIIKNIGKYYYAQYVHVGVLIEHDIFSDVHGTSQEDQCQAQVRFLHKGICEWYAAHYIATKSVTWAPDKWGNTFQSSSYLHNLCKSANNCDEFAILWIFDQGEYVRAICDIVKRLCSNLVKFTSNQKEILHTSMVRLLEIASSNKISISCVHLYNCKSTVYPFGGKHLQLKPNISIPVLVTLNKLTIEEDGREITAKEFIYILQYSSKCLALKELVFYVSLLPKSVLAVYVSILRSRNVKVYWGPRGGLVCYRLNLLSGRWEGYGDGTLMTDGDYQSVRQKDKPNAPQKDH